MASLAIRLKLWAQNRLWHWRLAAARRLLTPDARTWEALDRLHIPGHGIDLLRIDFPPDLELTNSWADTRRLLLPMIDAEQERQWALLDACLAYADDLRTWPQAPDPARPNAPWLDNMFLTTFDMAALYGMLRHRQPEQYVEIGSGLSTRVAAMARQRGQLPVRIISIDPEPRVEIAAICDRIERQRLEVAVDDVLAAITPRSILFFDGSHRCFPGSDVTVFFLALLPRLPAGTIVHIHDIFLPEDYPTRLRNRYWSEQYLLAAWLLGGHRRIRVLLPCARLAQFESVQAKLRQRLPTQDAASAPTGSSFWFEICA